MKNLCIISLLLLLFACQQEQTSSQVVAADSTSETTDSPKEKSTAQVKETNEAPSGKVIMDNPAAYAPSFVKSLEDFPGADLIELNAGLLILDQTDTLYMPDLPEFGKNYKFKGQKNDLIVEINLKRLNQTTISYETIAMEYGNTTSIQQGEAHISIGFLLGMESDENPDTGMGYFVWGYSFSKDDCYTSIRIGQEDDMNPSSPVFVKLIQNCLEGIGDIGLDDSPLLLEVKR